MFDIKHFCRPDYVIAKGALRHMLPGSKRYIIFKFSNNSQSENFFDFVHFNIENV